MINWLLTHRHRRLLPLAGATLLLVGCGEDKSKPLQVPAEQYQPMVAAFYTGVTALVVKNNKLAKERLELAAQVVPKEPATWVNLALLDFSNSDLAAAAKDLEKAASLSPPNSRIEQLEGILAGRQGRTEEALEHLRKAVELDSGNLQARWALVQEISRQSTAGSDAEVERQLQQIVAAQPGNLKALLDLTRLAAKNGDAAALRERIARLKALSSGWPLSALEKLKELEKAVARGDTRTLTTQILILENVLKQTPAFQQSYAALQPADANVADPLDRFIRLPNPSPTPAAPDSDLTFTSEPSGSAKCAWATAYMLSPTPPPATDLEFAPDGPFTLVTPAGSSITVTPLAGSGGPQNPPPATLPFPGTATPEGVLAADWNNDYRPDLALAGSAGVRLLQQSASGAWADVTARSGLPPAVTGAAYTGAWAVDVELDGDLDIVLGAASGPPRVLRNNDDGTWAVIQPFAGISGMRALALGDLDGDGIADVAMLDGQGKPVVFQNERAGHFRLLPLPAGLGKVVALAVADTNRDGVLDLVVLAADGSIRQLSRKAGTDGWDNTEIARSQKGPADASARLFWADLDNNGAADLVVSDRQATQVWLTDAQGKLSPLPSPIPARALSAADLNGDGRLDLVGVSTSGSPVRLINHGRKSYHWQVIRPRNDSHVRDSGSSGNQKFNSFGVGGEADLRAALLAQKQSITGPRLHFGLGDQATANYVRITWPNGQIQGEFDLKADQSPLAKQRLTSSCPWLFAHDGEAMQFVTDILWKSPLGLRINAQATAGVSQTRDWVKIRGDQLKARDGCYDLAITAELWETDFFDFVSLVTVDHPTGSELFVDERFSIPQPPLKLHATGPTQPVTRAWDERHRDVTDVVRARDGRYLDSFPLGRYQGVAQDHFVEVGLPEFPVRIPIVGWSDPNTGHRIWKTDHLFLVASGWIFPTDSSINVALSQGQHAAPRGLSLEIQDRRGKWVTARSGLGFPAGKNKNVLIDLTGLWDRPTMQPRPGQPRRLRLRTNLEIYWDSLAVAAVLPDARLQTREIAPRVADLSYRGFSAVHQPARSSPELPDYNRINSTAPQWLDLIGYYTRFGDVRELLKQVDDRYVMMNASDQISLRFPAPPPPPAGWVRDFVFVSDGWDKDGNFNTGFSKTVLPLPSHDQPEYNRPPGRLEDDPVYRRHPADWQTYHTRYVTPDRFRRALWPTGQPPAAHRPGTDRASAVPP